MGLTLLATPFVLLAALGAGIAVGRWRGPLAGIFSGVGVLAAAVLAYVVLLTLASSM